MKLRTLTMGLILAILLQAPVQAVSPRVDSFAPTLTFDGTTANCSIYVRGKSTDKISVTLELWRGEERVGYWTDSSTSYVAMDESATVVKGQFYELTATVSINGVLKASVPASGTCKQEVLSEQS